MARRYEFCGANTETAGVDSWTGGSRGRGPNVGSGPPPERAPGAALSRARLQSLDVGGGQRPAADPPLAAGELVNPDPGHPPHGLAFDLDQRIGHLLDHLLL